MKEFFTVTGVSESLDMPEGVIYYEIRKGKLDHKKYGGRVFISQEGIDYLKDKKDKKENLITVEEYCEKYRIGRGAFNYRVSQKRIKIVKIDGSVYVQELIVKKE